MKVETLKAIVAMMPVASDDVTRYNICGVHIEQVGTKTVLKATNGHMLIVRELDDKLPSGQYMAYADDLRALKVVIKDCFKHIEEFDCAIDSRGGLFFGTELGSRARIAKFESEFPPIRQAIPVLQRKVAITLNADYISAIAKAIGNHPSGLNGVRIVFDPLKPTGAVLIERDGQDDFTAVIMPMRDPGTNEIAEAFSERVDNIPDNAAISLAK